MTGILKKKNSELSENPDSLDNWIVYESDSHRKRIVKELTADEVVDMREVSLPQVSEELENIESWLSRKRHNIHYPILSGYEVFDVKTYSRQDFHKEKRQKIWKRSLAAYPKREYSFDVRGFVAIVPFELKFLQNIISESTYILELGENWDDEGGKPFNYATWVKAVNFLVEYFKYIYSQTQKIMSPPEIFHSSKGKIDLLWKTDSVRLLINIPEDGDQASFYGDNRDGESIEGKVSLINPKFGLSLAIANLF